MEKIRTYTLQELADEYQIHVETMRNWIKPIYAELLAMYNMPKKRLRILLPKQVKRIREHLG